MSQQTLDRLGHLRKLNSNRRWMNHDLYRLMYREDLYIIAYERIKSKPGNMTPGTDGSTLDGFSLEEIQEIIRQMRTEQFHFEPVRTVYIPKSNGKMRKLGIPCVRDKVVQEVMRTILESIYDSPHGPYFLESSHGFRPNRSCHTALREFRGTWVGMNWLIEGDIRACFDELDHHVLVANLRKKIKDERFLNLIWKLLSAGYMDLHGEKKESLIGSPQGGIISPILANVYLHELDEFVQELRTKLERGREKSDNPLYLRLARQKAQLVKRGATRTPEFRTTVKQMRATPSREINDPNFIRVRYLRYADDWMVGICGSRSLAEEIKQEIKVYLQDQLKLTLSEEKTRITNARTEEALFLGTTLHIGSNGQARITLQADTRGKTFHRRSTGWQTVMKAPLPRLMKRLSERGFCTAEGKPTPKAAWVNLDMDQILRVYSSVNHGIQNYYRFADNWRHLSRIQYILEYSLAKTLARKFKRTVPQIFSKFGKGFPMTVPGKDGKADRQVNFYLNHDWKRRRDAFQSGTQTDSDMVETWKLMRTRSKLGKPCCVCGETTGKIVMHHVRHIRRLTNKRVAAGFNRILRAMNRKQVPVCEACHQKIHRGEYDQMRLTDLTYIPN